jgi:hypothetical protein
MKRHPKPKARALAGALAILTTFALTAPPAAAETGAEASPAESTAPPPSAAESPGLLATAEARIQSSDPAEAVAAAQASEMTSEKSFLSSPQGIAAVALLVGGAVLVAYSRSNDRPTSPVR